jgi:hypothetical protein
MEIAQKEWIQLRKTDPEKAGDVMPGWRRMTLADLKRKGIRIWEPLPKVDVPPGFDVAATMERLHRMIAVYDEYEAAAREAAFNFFRQDGELDFAVLDERLRVLAKECKARMHEIEQECP